MVHKKWADGYTYVSSGEIAWRDTSEKCSVWTIPTPFVEYGSRNVVPLGTVWINPVYSPGGVGAMWCRVDIGEGESSNEKGVSRGGRGLPTDEKR